MSLTYSSFIAEIATLTVISSTVLVNGDNNFGPIMPGCIDYLEGRIYRDLDLPAARITDTTVSCSSGVRTLTLPNDQGTILEIESLNLLTSAGATSSFATRIPLMPTSKAVIDAVFPSAASSNCAQPQYFARIDDDDVMFGPTPDQPYGTEIVGVIRPNPLSAGNSSTWISQNLPELMVAAGMVFMAGFMRDYGSQADDPKLSQSWENQYQTLMKSANVDALRQKFQSQQWTSEIPSPVATPARA